MEDQVDPVLLVEWKKEKATLDTWTERFGIATSVKGVLNEDVLKETKALQKAAREFKTL
jgi:hypothetical protein